MAVKKILVAEDSPTMRQLITFTLKKVPELTVVEAADGAEAIRLMESESFDVIITDINMPLVDGLKVLSVVRAGENTKDVPVIIVTTAGGEEDKKKGLALGANAYLSKPIQTAELLKIVNGYLGA